jgi:hypothetical protein
MCDAFPYKMALAKAQKTLEATESRCWLPDIKFYNALMPTHWNILLSEPLIACQDQKLLFSGHLYHLGVVCTLGEVHFREANNGHLPKTFEVRYDFCFDIVVWKKNEFFFRSHF